MGRSLGTYVSWLQASKVHGTQLSVYDLHQKYVWCLFVKIVNIILICSCSLLLLIWCSDPGLLPETPRNSFEKLLISSGCKFGQIHAYLKKGSRAYLFHWISHFTGTDDKLSPDLKSLMLEYMIRLMAQDINIQHTVMKILRNYEVLHKRLQDFIIQNHPKFSKEEGITSETFQNMLEMVFRTPLGHLTQWGSHSSAGQMVLLGEGKNCSRMNAPWNGRLMVNKTNSWYHACYTTIHEKM